MNKKKFIAAVICIAGVIARKCKDKCVCDSCNNAEDLLADDSADANTDEPVRGEVSSEEPN